MMGGRDDMGVKDATAEAMNQVNQSVGITNKYSNIIAKGTDMILGILQKTFDFLKTHGETMIKFLQKNWPLILGGLVALQFGLGRVIMSGIGKLLGGVLGKIGKLVGLGGAGKAALSNKQILAGFGGKKAKDALQ